MNNPINIIKSLLHFSHGNTTAKYIETVLKYNTKIAQDTLVCLRFVSKLLSKQVHIKYFKEFSVLAMVVGRFSKYRHSIPRYFSYLNLVYEPK